MIEHDDAVDFYTVGIVHMRLCFPHGKADCRHCRFLRFREHLNLYQCSLTVKPSYCSPLPIGLLFVRSSAVIEKGEGENSRIESPLLASGIL